MKTFTLGFLFTVCCVGQLASAQSRKPNIILILADDLGYETIGANGGTSYKTPVLDKLAATGARFTHAYAQPLCTPTRLQLMTGQYNVRNYVSFGALGPNIVTFGNLLKQAGYATGMVGKWQLGQELALPQKLGFDEAFLWQHTRRPPRYANPGLEINGVGRDYNNGEYGPDILNDYALDFVARQKSVPFFLYYAMLLPHAPYQPTPDSPDWDPKAVGEQVNRHETHFGDMVSYMDKLIGKLVAKLDELGIRNDTLIVFVGDNGTGRGTKSMMGDKLVTGAKGSTVTYGMHVPMIANWPSTVNPGTAQTGLVDTTDVLPTLLDAAGAKPAPQATLDGRSVLPQLRGQKGQPREWVYSWYSPRQLPNTSMAVRECAFNARYKLYRTGEFFDLSNDVEEKTPMNVAALTGEAAAAAKLLQGALDRYHKVRPVELDRMFEREIKKDDSLSEEGKLFDASGAWKADLRVDTIEAPEGVRLVIGRRLDRLGAHARTPAAAPWSKPRSPTSARARDGAAREPRGAVPARRPVAFPFNGPAIQASGLNTRRKPRPAKSFRFTVANSRTPWATRHRANRAS